MLDFLKIISLIRPLTITTTQWWFCEALALWDTWWMNYKTQGPGSSTLVNIPRHEFYLNQSLKEYFITFTKHTTKKTIWISVWGFFSNIFMTNIFPILSLQTVLNRSRLQFVMIQKQNKMHHLCFTIFCLLSLIFFLQYNVLLHIELSAFIDFNCILFYHWSINFIKTIRLMSLLKKFV